MGRKYHENLEGTNNVNWSNLEGKTGSKDYASEVNVYSTKAQDISNGGKVKVYDAKFVAKNWNDSETRKMAWSYIQKATYNEIKEHLRALQSTVKGRVARLKASGIPSPALDVWEKNTRGMGWSNARIYIKGFDRDTLIHELACANQFLSSETSTVGGAKKVMNQAFRRLGFEPDTMNQTLVSNMYKIINKVKEVGGFTAFQFNYERLAGLLEEEYGDFLRIEEFNSQEASAQAEEMFGEILQRGMDAAREIYEQQMASRMDAFENAFRPGRTFNW